MPKIFRHQTIRKVGWTLDSAIWGARKDPTTAVQTWSLIFARSLNLNLSREARRRLRWFFDYSVTFKGNARKTCRYHGISAKTFYYWKNLFDITNPRSLENRSKRPKTGPLPVLNPEQSRRIFELRSKYPRYSKMKLAVLYEKQYGEKVSTWQFQRMIQRYDLYPDLKRARRIAWKRKHTTRKDRIYGCPKERWTGWLVSIDTVVVQAPSCRYFILTAVDRHSRLLCTRAYARLSAKNAADFLVCTFPECHSVS